MEEQWYALRVRSNFEKQTSIALRGRGVEEYLPVYRRRYHSGRTRAAERPLFPGYVFGRFDINRRCPILMIPGVLYILGLGRVPAAVDPEELAAVKAMAESGLGVEPCPFLKQGESLQIVKGPLRGLQGIVVDLKKNCRLVVSVTLLQRSVSAEIDRDWVDRPS